MGKRRTELSKPNMLLSDLELEANFFVPVAFSYAVDEGAGLVAPVAARGGESAQVTPNAT